MVDKRLGGLRAGAFLVYTHPKWRGEPVMNTPHAEKPAKKQARIPKLTREQIREGLDQVPIDHILGITGKENALTHKQREFAKAVAVGKTKAQAYRESYKENPAPSTIVTAPYTLAADPRIKREIECYKLAIEAEKHRTPAQLRAHLIHQLVNHSIDPETPPAQQIKALELIGKLYEVGAFMERKETTIVHQSSSIKAKLIERLRSVVDVEVKGNDDGLDLLEELKDGKQASADPTAPPPPLADAPPACAGTHTIPLKQSDPLTIDDSETNDPFSEDVSNEEFWKNISESKK